LRIRHQWSKLLLSFPAAPLTIPPLSLTVPSCPFPRRPRYHDPSSRFSFAARRYVAEYVSGIQQRYTQSGGVRPFGISTLIMGFDAHEQVTVWTDTPSNSFGLEPAESEPTVRVAPILARIDDPWLLCSIPGALLFPNKHPRFARRRMGSRGFSRLNLRATTRCSWAVISRHRAQFYSFASSRVDRPTAFSRLAVQIQVLSSDVSGKVMPP